MADKPMIEMRGVGKWFGRFQVLKDVDLRVAQGEKIVLCGPSGSGKSTLVRLVNGLEPYQAGRVVVDGIELANDPKSIEAVRREVGMVFQSFNLFPHLDVMGNLMIAQQRVKKRSKAEAERVAREMLGRVGLSEKADAYPGHLSGGQQQRVAIARALSRKPKLILADEPTGNLDRKTGGHVIDLLFGLQRRREATLILVTHDEKLAGACGRIIHMADGRVESETEALAS